MVKGMGRTWSGIFCKKFKEALLHKAAQDAENRAEMLTLFYMYFFTGRKMNRRLNFCYKNTLNLRFVISKDTKGFQMGF